MHDVYHFSYTSSATHLMSPDDLHELLIASRRLNADDEISGFLVYRSGAFLQYLEGPEEHVRSCMERIRRDTRHRGLIRLSEGYRTRRIFPNWSMGFRNIASMPDQDAVFEFNDESLREFATIDIPPIVGSTLRAIHTHSNYAL